MIKRAHVCVCVCVLSSAIHDFPSMLRIVDSSIFFFCQLIYFCYFFFSVSITRQISMVISYFLLKARYKYSQFAGAFVVCIGIVVVLLPSFIHPDATGNNAALWAFIMIFSCVPMCLSSVYKEKALGEVEIDPIYLNGWVAVFQFLCSIPLLLPSAPASNVAIKDLPQNLWDGAKCYVGINTVTTGDHADDCTWSPLYVTIYMVGVLIDLSFHPPLFFVNLICCQLYCFFVGGWTEYSTPLIYPLLLFHSALFRSSIWGTMC